MLVDVTPALARRLFQLSQQRRIYPHKVEALVRSITGGRWDPSLHKHQPIVVRRGRLVNGNHRVRAVIECGLTVPMWVKIPDSVITDPLGTVGCTTRTSTEGDTT